MRQRYGLLRGVSMMAVMGLAGASAQADAPMVGEAKTFLGALRAEQKPKTQLPFNSDERLNWHFVPKERFGITFKEMDEKQKEAALALLKSGLSQKGLKKVLTIRSLEAVLKELENGNAIRDTENYHFSVFGEPTAKGAWAWRYEGHHVSLNWTMLDGKVIASSPQFLGTNPGEVRQGPMKGTRVLGTEEDLGRALLLALTAEQKRTCLLSETAPNDIITSNQRKAAILEDKGLAWSEMTRVQQGMLLSIIQEYASVQTPAMAKKRLDAIRKAGLDTIKFAWMGSAERGQGHYYRVQGATFLIEYDNTQNNANHVHAVWRDFKGDFGADLLEMHYRASKHNPDGTHSP